MRSEAGTASQFTFGFQLANMPDGLFFQIHAWSIQIWKSSLCRKSWPNSRGAGPSRGAMVYGTMNSTATNLSWPLESGSYSNAFGSTGSITPCLLYTSDAADERSS